MSYTPPTPAQIRAFLRRHGLTGSQAAELAGLSGANKIRAMTGGSNPAPMSYAIQFALAAHVVLDEAVLARVKQAMPVMIADVVVAETEAG